MAFAPTLFRPTLLALLARNPDLFQLLTSTTDEQDIREVTLCNPAGTGVSLRDLGLAGSLLVLAIARNGEVIVPHGNTRLELQDRLTLLGDIPELVTAAQWLEEEKT
jgi:CPA2 family monovalent cation:H+ antiporter-2